jgi:Fibronectin type III domain
VGLQSVWSMMAVMMVYDTEAANIQLAWDPPAEVVAGYKLYYGQSSGNYEMVIDIGNHTSYILSGLEGDQRYYFSVTAYDNAGNESLFANEVNGIAVEGNSPFTEGASTSASMDGRGGGQRTDGVHTDGVGTAVATSPGVPPGDMLPGALHHSGVSDVWNSPSPLGALSKQLISEQIEIGEVQVGHQWKRVEFRKTFVDPVVVAKATSDPQAALAVLAIRTIDTTGFEMRLQPWDEQDRLPRPESVGYLVIERGRYTLMNEILVEARIVEAGNMDVLNRITFGQRFSVTPVVISAVVSGNQADVVRGKATKIGRDGFQYHLEMSSPSHAMGIPVHLAYVAWEPSWGVIDGLTFEVKRSRHMTPDLSQAISFEEIFVEPPVFLADVQGAANLNTPGVRWTEKNLAGVVVTIDLDGAAHGTTTPSAPEVGYMAISEM